MPTLTDLKPLTQALLDIQHLNSASALLSWDQETYMPRGGGEARAELLAAISSVAHDKLTGPLLEKLLGQHVDLEQGRPLRTDWDEEGAALLREVWRDWRRAKKLPLEHVRRLSRETSLAQQAWERARADGGFDLFAPHLETVLALKREETEYLAYLWARASPSASTRASPACGKTASAAPTPFGNAFTRTWRPRSPRS